MHNGNSKPVISLENVEKIYKTKAGPLRVLKGVDLQIGEGEFYLCPGSRRFSIRNRRREVKTSMTLGT